MNKEKEKITSIIKDAKTIAVVGHSANPDRTSYQVADYLSLNGFKIYPVNPSVETINGSKSYSSLKEIPEKIDIVQVFRRPEHLLGIVEEAIEVKAKAVWGQYGVEDVEAERTAKNANMPIIMDKCLKVEHKRFKKETQ